MLKLLRTKGWNNGPEYYVPRVSTAQQGAMRQMAESESTQRIRTVKAFQTARFISSRLIFRRNGQTATFHVVYLQGLNSVFDSV